MIRTFKVTANGRDRSVQSDLTDQQAHHACTRLIGRFARDLSATPLRALSQKQIAWLHVMATEAETGLNYPPLTPSRNPRS